MKKFHYIQFGLLCFAAMLSLPSEVSARAFSTKGMMNCNYWQDADAMKKITYLTGLRDAFAVLEERAMNTLFAEEKGISKIKRSIDSLCTLRRNAYIPLTLVMAAVSRQKDDPTVQVQQILDTMKAELDDQQYSRIRDKNTRF